MMPIMNGNGGINLTNVSINNAQDTDRILTEQEILSAPDCIDSALKHGKRPADYCSDKSFKAFWGVSKEDMDREIKIEQKVSEEVSNRNFERTWGMSKEEMYEKNLADAKKQLADQKEEKIGSVFEKEDKLDKLNEQTLVHEKIDTKVKGLDPKVLDSLRDQVDMLDSSKKEAELKSKDEATMSGPATRSSFGDLK